MKQVFPIIVEELEPRHDGDGEKAYNIYCMAPYVNAFNEVIEVRYQKRGWPRPRWGWEVSKGCSGGCDPETTALLVEGYQIALALIAGDTSKVSPKPLVAKFQKAYWAKQKRREEARRKAYLKNPSSHI